MTTWLGAPSAPADQAAAVTKSDVTVLDPPTRALYIGGDGNLTVRMAGPDQNTVQFIGLVAGTILPLRVDQVLDATTATNIIALR